MSKPELREIEHGVVIPCGEENVIPASRAWAQEQGIRGMHYGWPGLTRTKEGDLLVGASQRIRHIDPYGREVVAHSSDKGRTWSAPEVIFDSVTDDRDQALNTLPDGTVIFTWFSSSAWAKNFMRPAWQPMLDRVTPDTLNALARGWLRRSTDGGRTWEDRVYPTIVGQHAGPTPLSNGDIIYLGPLRREPGEDVVMAATRSSDGGRTWQIIGEVPSATVQNPETGATSTILNENHVIELRPGELLGAFRIAGDPRNIHIAHSSDGGCTWSEAKDTGVYGFPPYLVKLSSGRILCVYSDRREPRTIRAMFSDDEGKSWDAEHLPIIRQLDVTADMGYPVALELSPGEVLCVYYAIPKADQPGYGELDMNEWGILSTRFRV